MKKIFIGLSVLVFLALIGGFFALMFTSKAMQNAHTFVEVMAAGETDKAYAMTSESFHQDYTQTQFNELYSEQEDLVRQITEISLNSIEIKNDNAEVSGYIKNSEGFEAPVMINLVKEQEEWKVYSFDFQFGAAQQE